MKKLTQLIKSLAIKSWIGDSEKEIKNIHFDSRKVEKQDLFVAIKGLTSDGHSFIDSVIQQGAHVIICEHLPENIQETVSYLVVENTAEALGIIASNYYDNPSSKMKVIGITGTNGKTTTTTLLHQLMLNLGHSAALISTVENKINQTTIPSKYTTPDPIALNLLLSDALDAGCEYVFMEVSSQGYHQQRIAGIHIHGAGFTNITHDHLDYHKTFDEYIRVKKKYFDDLPSTAFAITNLDDKNGIVMLQNTKAKKKTYALKTIADYKGKMIENRMDGMLLNFDDLEFWLPLAGAFNAYNALLVYGIACELGFSKIDILTQLSLLNIVKGRFETFTSATGIILVIDYAHTPDALENVLNTLNQTRTKQETLFCVFGCGGNKDVNKRPEMGKIATKLADKVMITSDNPRNEDPSEIINQIKNGVSAENYSKYITIEDRKEAIKTAINLANKGDIILIAGKGHENYQEIKGVRTDFDDLEISKNLLIQMNK